MKQNKIYLLVSAAFAGVMYFFFFTAGILPGLLMILKGAPYEALYTSDTTFLARPLSKYIGIIIIGAIIIGGIFNKSQYETYNDIWKKPLKAIIAVCVLTIGTGIYVSMNHHSSAYIWSFLSSLWVFLFFSTANVLYYSYRFHLPDKTIDDMVTAGKSSSEVARELVKAHPNAINCMEDDIKKNMLDFQGKSNTP